MRIPLAHVALAASCLAGCGDPSAPPNNLRVVVATTGLDPDPDGYRIIVDDRLSRRAPVDAIFEFLFEPGAYEIRIEGLAPNCTVQGPATAAVEVQGGLVAEAKFSVECRAVTGVIEVLAPTAGRDFPNVGYSVYVTDESAASWLVHAWANGTTLIPDLAPGQYQVRFAPTAPNCALTGEDTRTVSVTAGGLVRDTARVEFAVTCTATTGDVRLSVTTNAVGGVPDPDGYTVKVDGVVVEESVYDGYYGDFQVPLRLALNGSRLLERLAPGEHTIELGDLAGGCAVTGGRPLTVSATVGAVADVSMTVVCGTAP